MNRIKVSFLKSNPTRAFLGAFTIMSAIIPFQAQADVPGYGVWPTPWSHNLPRPLIFVHGVNADMGSWGVRTGLNLIPVYDYAGGNAAYYTEKSAAKALALANGMPESELHSEGFRTTTYINHNGIEFYNSLAYGPDGNFTALDPFATIRFTNGIEYDNVRKVFQKGQSNQLYDKMIGVLDEYYSDWRTNSARQIDIVCHSQGCLVTRNVIANKRDQDLSNPVNHINSIVSVNSPAMGTAFATDLSGVHSVERLRGVVFGLYNKGLLNSQKATTTILGMKFTFTVDPFKDIRNMLENFMVAQKELQYPSGIAANAWSPLESKMGSTGIIGGSPIITPLVHAPLSRPYDNRKIPLTALYGVTPNVAKSMLTKASITGHSACTESHYGVTADDISFWFQSVIYLATGGQQGTCSNWVDYVVNYLDPIFTELDSQWSPKSDFVVDESSQRYQGALNPYNHPFISKKLTPNPGESAVPHMTLPGLGNDGDLLGANTHGAEMDDALKNKPVQKSMAPALSLLLQ